MRLLKRIGFGLFMLFALLAIGWFTPLLIVCMFGLIPLMLILAGSDQAIRMLLRREIEHPIEPSQVRNLISAPIAAAAVLAPLRVVHVLIRDVFGWRFVLGRVDYVDLSIATFGVLLGMAFGIPAVRDLLREAQQLRNLPRSKAHSLAMGLVEVQGVVEPVPDAATLQVTEGHRGIAEAPAEAVLFHAKHFVRSGSAGGNQQNLTLDIKQPFYVADETGRVLVDPRAAAPYDLSGLRFWTSATPFWQQGPKIYLRRRRKKEGMLDYSEQSALLSGDRVTVIGTCELGDGERVVSPGPARQRAGFLSRWFPYLYGGKLTAYANPFLVSDVEEGASRVLVRGQIVQACVYAAVWLVPAGWLLVTELQRLT